MNAPGVSLKVIVVVHFVLTTWAILIPFLPAAYTYMNTITLLTGIFCIVFHENADAALLLLVLHLISILNDIIMLSIYQPIGHHLYEEVGQGTTKRNTYRFSLGMSIVNLIIKPLTGFVLFRIFQDRGGESSANWIPGLPNFNNMPGNYENIDQPVPTNTVETASPHHSIDTPPGDQMYGSKGPGHP